MFEVELREGDARAGLRPDYIRTPRGDFILRREVVRWVERDSPGWGDHQKIIVILRNGEELNTGMYAREWLKEWEQGGGGK